jgi:FkbM family methyltransferase
MSGARKWMGELLLHSPVPLQSLRGVPVLGKLVHGLSHRLLPAEEKIWAQIETGPAQGIWLELNPRTGRNYIHGEAEIAIQKTLAERVRPGTVFYDLGANIGLFTLLAARLVGSSGKVFSFEPDVQAAARLRRNIGHNGFENVSVVEAGVWSSSGNLNFVASDPSSPDHGLGQFTGRESTVVGTPTRCVSLDDFIQNAPPPDAIKCDVEGAEVEVFRGAKKLLQTRRPWIVCEIHSEGNERALRDHLTQVGYKIESVDTNHILASHP